MSLRRATVAAVALGCALVSSRAGAQIELGGQSRWDSSLGGAATRAVSVVAIDQNKQDRLETAHSVLQKTGLGMLAVTDALGAALAINHNTVFGDGRCTRPGARPIFGAFGCEGLTLVHFGFAVATVGLFAATEIVAAEMPISPYDDLSQTKQTTMRTLRWVNVGLFSSQALLGLLAAHPGLLGIPPEYRAGFSRVMRTIHIGVGLAATSTYTVNAALQW